jgi:phosphotransferase system  glucose/maltose/N-acetylglucosamine-specific IIC component
MLGTLNALCLTVVAGTRAFSPALFTSIFAIGVGKQILGGYLVWVIMIVLAAVLVVVLRWLPPKAEGKTKRENEED